MSFHQYDDDTQLYIGANASTPSTSGCRNRISLHWSQLYGSTTVVMATYALHWKWRISTPCQRHPSDPIEKIFGTIDYVIDLNNLAKFGFGKIFRDWGTYTQHIRVCAFFFFFFLTFYALRHAHSLNGWTDFHAQYLKRRRLVQGGAFSMIEKFDLWPWPLKGQNPPFCSAFKILTGIISKTVRDREMVSIEVK